ncbi:hypothetical protein Daus18300_002569 [Diaporthe australafricana]|uniref:Uncharacterized protein n=1 Tax=Diaporthe australafricana TaxID=127596 RepID=A0ABR3XLV0_9PEZI
MSTNTNIPTTTTKPGEDTSYPGEIGLSRWAPGGLENQLAGEKKPKQTGNQDDKKDDATDKKISGGNAEHNKAAETTAATRRIIGPLSVEEQAVRVENPFFDPNKDKGLSSSRWAQDQDQPLSRWAPGGIEEQMASTEANTSPVNKVKKTINEKQVNTTGEKQHKGAGAKGPKTAGDEQQKSTATTKRLIGPLTAEFFDSEKDKGLANSSWADAEEEE